MILTPLQILVIKGIAVLILMGSLFGAYAAWHHHVYQEGVTDENGRWLKIEADATLKASNKLAAANKQVATAQAALDTATLQLSLSLKELQNEKDINFNQALALRTGAKRMWALVHTPTRCPAGSPEGTSPVDGDQGTEVAAELDATLASDITNDYSTGDQAIRRLNACISAYDSVKAATDKLLDSETKDNE